MSDRFRRTTNDTLPAAGIRMFPAALTLALLFIFTGVSGAAPANPRGAGFSQPDGSKVLLFLRGDEFYSWHEDRDGYTVLKDSATGWWVYAGLDDTGSLQPGKLAAGRGDPSSLGLTKHLKDAVGPGRAVRLRGLRDSALTPYAGFRVRAAAPPKAPVSTRTLVNLVILARFADQTTTFSRLEMDSLFNTTGYAADGAVGSVRDYYNEVSYNSLTIQTTVSQWVVLPGTYAFYGSNNDAGAKQMVSDAIFALAASGFDFSAGDGDGDGVVDSLDIIHSGGGEETAGNDPDYRRSGILALPGRYGAPRRAQGGLHHTS